MPLAEGLKTLHSTPIVLSIRNGETKDYVIFPRLDCFQKIKEGPGTVFPRDFPLILNSVLSLTLDFEGIRANSCLNIWTFAGSKALRRYLITSVLEIANYGFIYEVFGNHWFFLT